MTSSSGCGTWSTSMACVSCPARGLCFVSMVAAQFDCRIWMGAQKELVLDYFRWRQADAARCALNGWAYWTLRKAGRTVEEATTALHSQSVAYKNELLFQNGINFNDVPTWQKRGTGVYWETFQKERSEE